MAAYLRVFSTAALLTLYFSGGGRIWLDDVKISAAETARLLNTDPRAAGLGVSAQRAWRWAEANAPAEIQAAIPRKVASPTATNTTAWVSPQATPGDAAPPNPNANGVP